MVEFKNIYNISAFKTYANKKWLQEEKNKGKR